MPAALTNYAVNGGIRSALDLDAITSVVTTSDYLVTWVIATGIVAVLVVVISFLSLHVVGLVVAPFVIFPVAVAITRLFATAYRRVAGSRESVSV